MATIKPIDSGTIHRIQSGQVIVDLCSVAKELIENSVDAGATSIDVRFKNQGLDSIEVQDNGGGVSPENYESVALKHHTSKLSSYDDISNLQTFGFRGEALSSLSALSQLSMVTCVAADVPKGCKLKFASSGALEDQAVIPAKQGTTVIVENLFHNLPVRRRELERHIKREWAKLIALLNQYACILTGVKFTVSQQPSKGKKIVLFSTKGNPTTRDNVMNIFGAKTMTALILLDLTLTMEPSSTAPRLKHPQGKDDGQDSGSNQVSIKGHVSRPAHGEGRQAPDRQMFFVNGRPCGLPQFAKVFNEVYKAFNSAQSPFIFADIQLDTHLYDVNVSPDKRTIMLHDQGRMLDNLREELNALFEEQDYQVPTAQLASQRTASIVRTTPARASTTSTAQSSTNGAPDAATPSPSPALNIRKGRDRSTEHDSTDNGGPEDEDALPKRIASSKSASGGTGMSNLLNNWVEPRTSARSDEASGSLSPTKSPERSAELDDDMYTATPVHVRSRPVEDSRGRLAELAGGYKVDGNGRIGSRGNEVTQAGGDAHEMESGTPSGSQERPSPHPLKPAAPEFATITIGSHTVTSVIGTPSKRHRGDPVTSSLPDKARSKLRRPAESAMPSFGGRLSQMFSATASNGATAAITMDRAVHAEPVNDEDEGEASGEEAPGASDEEATSPGLFVDCEDDPELEAEKDGPGSDFAGDDVANVATPCSQDPLQEAELEEEGSVAPAIREDGQPGEASQQQPSAQVLAEERQTSTMKGASKKRDTTFQYEQRLRVRQDLLASRLASWTASLSELPGSSTTEVPGLEAASEDAEEKLSLTISKGDFGKMKIIGQFNLGFILAVRPGGNVEVDEHGSSPRDDELFIIDQHASDEKYNFERLQAATVVQSQRLVHPKTLDLTALEEEIVLENLAALETNGFKVTVDESGEQPVGSRCQLLALPLSKETIFTLKDLEELISLLGESHATSETTAVPRPSKVRKMFAMRACRSSVMIGHALQQRQMVRLVRHMGELDKPWNCPHGRPTMRHLTSLRSRDGQCWDGDAGPALKGLQTSWDEYLQARQT